MSTSPSTATIATVSAGSSAADAMARTPKLAIRPAAARGIADHGWLRSAHTFSFADYHDRRYMQHGVLRVINDDEVAAGAGFPSHSHRDAEIFSYVLEGALEHKDSMGNGSVVKAGGVQYMSAGSGVTHSEFNPSSSEPVRFLQVWLLPAERDVVPRYETIDIAPADKAGRFKLFLSPDGRNGSIATKANAFVHAATLDGAQVIEHDLGDAARGWLQVARGRVSLNGQKLVKGDGVAIEGGGRIRLADGESAEVLLFELP